MCTARLEPVRGSSFSGHHQMSLGGVGSPQMKKFEQVSSDHQQMSLLGGRYDGAYPMMHLFLPTPEQTNTYENITFPQFRWREVIKKLGDFRKFSIHHCSIPSAGFGLISSMRNTQIHLQQICDVLIKMISQNTQIG